MPSWNDLRRYLNKKPNGWEPWKTGRHHDYWRKVLPNGEILTTRVSHGSGEIPPGVWKRILSKQLRITNEEFNRDK